MPVDAKSKLHLAVAVGCLLRCTYARGVKAPRMAMCSSFMYARLVDVSCNHSAEMPPWEVCARGAPISSSLRGIHVDDDLRPFTLVLCVMQGMFFGCLPFEMFRVLASLALASFFAIAMWRNRPTVLRVHYMIFGVMVLETLEAMSWLGAYKYMNASGECISIPVKFDVG